MAFWSILGLYLTYLPWGKSTSANFGSLNITEAIGFLLPFESLNIVVVPANIRVTYFRGPVV